MKSTQQSQKHSSLESISGRRLVQNLRTAMALNLGEVDTLDGYLWKLVKFKNNNKHYPSSWNVVIHCAEDTNTSKP